MPSQESAAPVVARPLWWAAAAVAATLALALPLPSALATLALLVVFAWAPGALLSARLFPDWSPVARLFAALSLSPFLIGAPIAAANVLGAPLPLAARVAAGIVALLALLEGRPRARPVPAPVDRVTLIAAIAWLAIIAAFLIGNAWLPPRSDGWFHAGVVLQIAERGLPPEDPYFAGLRLLYFWGYHAWAAGWLALAPRLAVWTPLVAFNLVAAFACVLGVGTFARRFGADGRGTALTCALAVGGYAPFSWLLVVAHAATGDVRGWAEVSRTVGSGVGPLLQTLSTGQLHASMAFFGDKFLVLTPFSMGLALFLLFVLALFDLIERPSVRTALALGVIQAAAFYTHSVIGFTTAALAGVWWVWGAWLAVRGEPRGRRALVPLALAIGGAACVMAPYLAAITLGKRSSVNLGFSRAVLLTCVIGGAFVIPAALGWLRRRVRTPGIAQDLVVLAVCITGMAMALHLPENNQSKFFNLLFLLLAAPAALGWQAWHRRSRPAVRMAIRLVLAFGMLPTVVLALWGFASEHGQSRLSWRAPSAAEAAGLAWVRASTPPDAMFCDLDSAADLLAIAGRSVLWGGPDGERDWGYPPAVLAARRAAVRSLCAGRAPEGDAASLLRTLPREVIVTARARYAGDSLSAWNRCPQQPERFTELYRNAELAFYRWEGPR